MSLLKALIRFLDELFGMIEPKSPDTERPPKARTPVVVDYSNRCWGHNVHQYRVRDQYLIGWGPLSGPCIEAGDVLRLPLGWRCTVKSIRYDDEVRDMWYAEVERWEREEAT